MEDDLDTSTKTQAWKTQSFLLSEICTVILWQDFHGKALGEPRKRLFLSMYVDDIKLAGKKTKQLPNVESTYERRRFGRTNVLP